MNVRLVLPAILAALLPAVLSAQQAVWGDLDPLLIRLSPTGAMERSLFLPDTADPATATRALGVVYAHIPGSAGSVSIHAGIFTRGPGGWALFVPVAALFGHAPRDQQFFPGRMEVTTTMLGPDDPRCCPTLAVRWSIDIASGVATRLN